MPRTRLRLECQHGTVKRVFLNKYMFGSLWTRQHTMKEDRPARRGGHECLRDISCFFCFLGEHFLCEYLYTVEELINK